MAHTNIDYEGYTTIVSESALTYAVGFLLWRWIQNALTDEEREYAESVLRNWRHTVENSGVGCLDLDLKGIVGTSAESQAKFISRVSGAEKFIASFGDTIPNSVVQQLGTIRGCPSSDLRAAGVLEALGKIRRLVLHESSKDIMPISRLQ